MTGRTPGISTAGAILGTKEDTTTLGTTEDTTAAGAALGTEDITTHGITEDTMILGTMVAGMTLGTMVDITVAGTTLGIMADGTEDGITHGITLGTEDGMAAGIHTRTDLRCPESGSLSETATASTEAPVQLQDPTAPALHRQDPLPLQAPADHTAAREAQSGAQEVQAAIQEVHMTPQEVHMVHQGAVQDHPAATTTVLLPEDTAEVHPAAATEEVADIAAEATAEAHQDPAVRQARQIR